MNAPVAERRWTTMIGPWSLTVALLAGAWVLNTVALPNGSSEASFVTRTTVGESGTTRNLELTVRDVRVTRTVTDPKGWSAEGTWLVVEVDAASRDSQYAASLGFAELTVGERTFRATERGETFYRARLVTGVPRSGSIAFELPADALKGEGTLRLGIPADARYDGLIEVPVALGDIPVEDEIVLPETGWTER